MASLSLRKYGSSVWPGQLTVNRGRPRSRSFSPSRGLFSSDLLRFPLAPLLGALRVCSVLSAFGRNQREPNVTGEASGQSRTSAARPKQRRTEEKSGGDGRSASGDLSGQKKVKKTIRGHRKNVKHKGNHCAEVET